MTKDEFEKDIAEIIGTSVECLRAYQKVIPCDCGEEDCRGWQMANLTEYEVKYGEAA